MGKIGRFAWLTAWAVWAWLGVGLARQLPRELGTPLCRFADRTWLEQKPKGFLAGTHVLVTLNEREGEAASLACWDADSGLKLHEYGEIPPASHAFGDLTNISLRHSIAAAVRLEERKLEPAQPSLQLLELKTGGWRKLGPLPWRPLAFHPERPWIAVSLPPDRERPMQVFVFDLHSLERLVEWTGEVTAQGTDHVRACHFLDGSGELLIVCDTFGEEAISRTDQRLIRIDVSSGAVSTTLRLPQAYRSILPPAGNGLMVMAGINERQDRTDIVDHRSGNVECSVVARKEDSVVVYNPADIEIWPAVLSPSGTTILTSAGLQRLNGKLVWTRDARFETAATRTDGKTFIVTEKWKPILKSARLSYDWTTYAVRDLEEGRVLYRTWQRPKYDILSSDGRLGVGDDLSVYSIPPLVNWPVLAMCQAVLALPLVFLWLAILWRRKRRLRRLAGAMP